MNNATLPEQRGAVDIYLRLLGYVKPYWPGFLLSTLALIIVAASEVGFAALMKPMMDGTFVERDADVIKWTPIVLIGLFLVSGTAAFIAQFTMAWIARKVIKVMRSEMFTHTLHLPVSYFDQTPSGTLISRMIYDVEQVATAATDAITVVIRDTLTIIGLFIWLFYLEWELTLILLLGAPLIALMINKINSYFSRYSGRIQRSMGDVTHIVGESIDGQREIKAYGGHHYESERFEIINEANRYHNLKLQATNAASVPIVQLIGATSASLVIYYALTDTNLSIGGFISFLTAMVRVLQPIKRLIKVTESIQRGIVASRSIFDFIDTPAESDAGKREIEQCRGEIHFDNLSFGYHGSEDLVLKNINLHIPAGKSVAFVGRSGSGKTTLVNLLPRFYTGVQGSIFMDGIEINELDLKNLRSHIALVSQHITLFNDTIANNISYGHTEEISEEKIIEAARAAHALEFIERLPNGFETLVGENGVLLSGGQRQRLAIARALLKNAPVLILDEATSALDTESERHIQQALEGLMQNRTTLVIAHRLSTIESADHIVVMDKGRIVESGTHRELLEHGGIYAALQQMQFQEPTSDLV